MIRKVFLSADGSHTIAVPEMNVTYHSIHGAIQESLHVFIEAGLNYFLNRSTAQAINIFEMGFGTGLNAFLTAIKAEETKTNIHYTSVETSPLSFEEASGLNYAEILGRAELFQQLHDCEWNELVFVNEFFTVEKLQTNLLAFSSSRQYNVIYYDAFAPAAQPELWTKEVFEKMFSMLAGGGVLVTYCSKCDVRRAMIAAGFTVKKLPGPPGKREMLWAKKI